jgi:transposase-like protein
MEQDHRFIKKRTKPMLGFKGIDSASITIAGIENIRMNKRNPRRKQRGILEES